MDEMVERWDMRSSLLLLLKGCVDPALLGGLTKDSGVSDSAKTNQFGRKASTGPNLEKY